MRKTKASMNDSIFTVEDTPAIQTFDYSSTVQTLNGGKKKRCLCLSVIWLMSNILTFTVGYYVKTKYFKDNCLVDEGGSL